MTSSLIPAEAARAFTFDVYSALGVAEADARLLSDTLVQADLWGHKSHGVMRTFWYAERIKSGAMKIDAPPRIVTDAGPIAVMDGRDGIGQVITVAAMKEAIARAKAFGVGVVSVRNSGHFGAAMYFTRMAAKTDCIGILTTNASPALAPWGGREKRIGNNPWSVAAPTGDETPMVLDIANTVVARGKIYHARERGEAIPDGWALDAEGAPTNDPSAAIDGIILPMGAHKGYAISTIMDVLSGVLSASSFATGVTGPYAATGRSGVGHLVIALDVAAFRPIEEFHADMRRLIGTIKETPTAPGFDEVFFPGELEARAEARNLVEGVPVPEDTMLGLNEGAQTLGLRPLSAY